MPSLRRAQLLPLALAVLLLAASLAISDSSARGRARERLPRLLPGQAPAVLLPSPRPRPRPRRGPVHPVLGRVTYGEGPARFGADRGGRTHEGQDVFAPVGTPVLAVTDAVVLEAGGGDARGNYLVLYDARARRTYAYLHMEAPASVHPGQRLRAGRRVDRVGCSGSCFGPHLHFEVRRGRGATAPALDPLPLLQRWARR